MKGTVVITGGTKGLGRETALAFARAGYHVVALYASDEAAAEKMRAALTNGCVVRHDVASEDAAVWSRPELRDAERLTLIHNACAAFAPVPMHQLRWQDFEAGLRVTIKGAWLCSQALIRPMLKQGGGTVVNILTSALDGPPPKGFAAYITAKEALRGFTLALAAEYAPRGLRVFSASPGFMDTPLTAAWDARLRDAIRAASPRGSDPAEAAERLLALVENEALATQGEDYPI